MILAALIVGLLVAYYMGVRAGGWAAAAAGTMFFLAALIPPLAIPVYGIVAVGIVAIFFIGPRRGPSPASRAAVHRARRIAARFLRR